MLASRRGGWELIGHASVLVVPLGMLAAAVAETHAAARRGNTSWFEHVISYGDGMMLTDETFI